MTKQQLRDQVADYVVQHAAEGDDPEDIIFEVCQKSGVSWARGERLVRQVLDEQSSAIARHRLPIYYISALFIFLGGMALMGYGIYSILESILQHEGLFPPDIFYYMIHGYGQGTYPFTALQPAVYPYFKWILGTVFSPISMIVIGVLMVLGSLEGMRDLWVDILNK